MVSFPSADLLQQVGALVAVAVSLLVLRSVADSRGRWGERLRSRFVLGVPWGTLVSVAGVAAFYLVAQHGFGHWYNPVTLPYRAWTYLYPFGMVTAPFAHNGSSHLVGNLTAALVVFPLAEYAFGHFPRDRGSQSFGSRRTNPLVRAFVVFPAGVAAVGVLTGLFSWGPIIGFSGVVFAGIGFALVRYPLAAVLAMVSQEAVLLGYRVLLDPQVTRRASERFVRPGWAGIAVQGHALGLFLGAAAGILVCYRGGLIDLPGIGDRRDDPPGAARTWFATLLLGLMLGLHQLWWYRGNDVYVLYRAAGLAFVALVAAIVVASVDGSDRPGARLRPARLFGRARAAVTGRGDDPDRPDGGSTVTADAESGPTPRQVATAVLLVPLLIMAGVALPVNATTVAESGAPPGTEPVEVRDYTVVYAEGVPNQMVSAIDVDALGETTQVNTSGVVVISERRHVWTTAISKAELAARGSDYVVVGGPTWRETVFVKREGWSAVGGPSAYRVRIGMARGDTRVAYTSEPATADAVLRGRNLSVVPAERGFLVRVSRNGSTLTTAPIPGENETVTARGITFSRDGRVVVASVGGTQVSVFRQERYD